MSKARSSVAACLGAVAGLLAVMPSASATTPSLLLNKATMGKGETISGAGGAGTLVTLASEVLAIKCTGASFKGTLTSTTEGSGSAVATGCGDSGGEKCQSGTTSGEITVASGPVRAIYDETTPALGVGVLLTNSGVIVVKCTGGLINPTIEIKGSLIVLAKPVNVEVESLEVVATESKGDAVDVNYWETTEQITKNEGKKALLLTKIGSSGQFESSGGLSSATISEFNGKTKQKVEAMG